jgi:hypothetical protein
MSIQLVAKGHHIRKITWNGEEEVRRPRELATTKQQIAQNKHVRRETDMGRKAEKKRNANTNIHNYI